MSEVIKKAFIIILLGILNSACSSLMNPQEQPVQILDSKTNIYMTTCSGMAESIGTCYQKAKRTCEKDYQVLAEKLDSSGLHREIRFKCN